MKKQEYRSGSVHLIVVIILILVLIGSLGFICYQNLIQKKIDDLSKTVRDKSSKQNENSGNKAVEYKEYTDSVFGVSFKYPADWSLTAPNSPETDNLYWNRSLEVKNDKGQMVAKLILGIGGLGGACSNDSNGEPILTTYTVLDSTPTTVKAKDSVSVAFIVAPNSQNDGSGYTAGYGLMSEYDKAGDYKQCLLYNTFESTMRSEKGNYEFSFGSDYAINGYTNNYYFATIEDARRYIQSDEYKEIKKMLMSFDY